jgi:hypothetical protein
MIYKKPVITLTSLLDLLFIIIFAYQIEIKTNADKFVQAEVSRGVDQNISAQKELIAELQAEITRVKDELEFVRERAESATKNAYEYKSQSEKHETQRDLLLEKIRDERKRTKDNVNNELQVEVYKQQVEELKNKLQRKERELLTVKQEKERIKRQRKSEGVIPITDRDAQLARALVGTWRESHEYRVVNMNSLVTLNSDNRFVEQKMTTANEDCMVGKLRLNKGESISSRITGKWWVKGGYIHYFVESSNNTKTTPIGHSSSQKVLSVGESKARFKWDDGSISTSYRID